MSKVNEIERRIRELEAGKFQQLCNAYLHRRGYPQINALGSVIGSEKTRRGTPDTFVPTNGRYVFVEYTTTVKGLYDKLKSDVEKCMSEKVTGVPIERIEEIVLCHTGQLDGGEQEALNDLCRGRVKLSILGIHPIALDLAEKYPGLARDHLGVEVDTGQILSPVDFVEQYGRNALAAPLNTELVDRQPEVSSGVASLVRVDVLLVSGPPGVGKSRVALAILEEFSKAHRQYQPWCLLDRGQDLFVDLKTYLSDDGSFIVLADDANRLSRFDYILDLIQSQRPGQRFKVIVTVRDYALERIREKAGRIGVFEDLVVEPMNDEAITEILQEDLGITNFHYLDRIRAIAAGNPRLAVMAARLAKRTNTLASIADATDLYEAYFGSIREDLESIDDRDLLRVAAIVALFRSVDRTHGPMMAGIESAFGITPESFWQSVRRLHALEVVDLYGDEVVRASDQVLSTYLFYRAFLKERSLQFSVLLQHFFPSLRDRLVDALNGALQVFNRERLVEVVRPAVLERWRTLIEENHTETLVLFMEIFGIFDPTACLLYAREAVQALPPEQDVDLMAVKLREEPGGDRPSALRVLTPLRQSDQDTVVAAIELLLDWAARRPSEAGRIVTVLRRSYGLTPRSPLVGYRVEAAVLDAVWRRASGGSLLFGRMFIVLAREHLRVEFEHSEAAGRHTLRLTHFYLPDTPLTLALREATWRRLFELYPEVSALRAEILDAIRGYAHAGHSRSGGELVRADARLVQSFVGDQLDPAEYGHCFAVHEAGRWFEREGVPFDAGLLARFTNPTFVTSELLLDRVWYHRGLGYEGFVELKKGRIADHVAGLREADLQDLWQQCETIRERLKAGEEHELKSALGTVLEALARRDRSLFVKTLREYLEQGDRLHLRPGPIVGTLLGAASEEEAFTLLASGEYSAKSSWLLEYYYGLPDASVNGAHLAALYALFESAPQDQLYLKFGAIAKYGAIDSRVTQRVVGIIVKRLEGLPGWSPLSNLFYSSETRVRLAELFRNDVDLLKQAYLSHLGGEPAADTDGSTLAQIVALEPSFLTEFIDWQFGRATREGWRSDRLVYDFLWRRHDSHELAERVADLARERDEAALGMGHEALASLFEVSEGTDAPALRAAQDGFLFMMVRKHSHDRQWITLLFEAIQDLHEDRRRECLRVFLGENKELEVFKELRLEPGLHEWGGSAVPMYGRRISYLESLLPLVSGLEYLDHKRYIEALVEELHQQTENEKRRDFMEDR